MKQNYIIGLKNKSYFYACNGGLDINFLCTNPEDAAKTNDIGVAKKLITSFCKKNRRFVDLNGGWDQSDDFKNVTKIPEIKLTKKDFVIFEFYYVVEEV
jgi:hypothetical protein